MIFRAARLTCQEEVLEQIFLGCSCPQEFPDSGVGVSTSTSSSSPQLPESLLLFLPLSMQVNQRNVPGIDSAYLAMDTEEGVEVVWNEVQFSERKNFKLQEVGEPGMGRMGSRWASCSGRLGGSGRNPSSAEPCGKTG